MSHHAFSHRRILWLWLLLAIAPLSRAELGGRVDSIVADRVAMKATLRQIPSTQFTIHEITTPSGIQVREYSSPAGIVFAVTWKGAMIPDLKQLLGTYFSTFQQAGAQHTGHGPLLISRPDFVMQSSGHMRAFAGMAYAPALVPSGVSVTDLH
jgi:hypothetical protein